MRAVSDSWREYEVQSRDFVLRAYRKLRAYHVDDDLVVAITDAARSVLRDLLPPALR